MRRTYKAAAIALVCAGVAKLAYEYHESVEGPTFAVAVQLTPAADSRLRSLRETIAVSAYFDGDGEPEAFHDTAPFRNVYLGSQHVEVDDKRAAKFSGKRFSGRAWRRLSDKNYYVTINVGSARKAVDQNLLWCGVPEERVKNVQGRTINVQCSLISEHKFGPNE